MPRKTIECVLLCFSSLIMQSLSAQSAFWTASTVGDQGNNWTNTQDWSVPDFTGRPNADGTLPITNKHPQFAPGIGPTSELGGQSAFFSVEEQLETNLGKLFSLASTEHTTLGELFIDVTVLSGASSKTSSPILFLFNQGLTFKGNSGVIPAVSPDASIVLVRGGLSLGASNQTITIASPLTITTRSTGTTQLNIIGRLAGNQDIIISTTKTAPITISTGTEGAYDGRAVVNTGGLLNLSASDGPILKHLTINGGAVKVTSGISQFYGLTTNPNGEVVSQSDIIVAGGSLNFNQTSNNLNLLKIFKNGVVNGGNILDFAKPSAQTTVLVTKGATLQVNELNFPEGSSIHYDASLPGSGSTNIGGNTRTSIFTSGDKLELDVDSASLAYELGFSNVDISGGGIRKIGLGTLSFNGNTNNVSHLDFFRGGLIFGALGGNRTNLGDLTLIVPQGTIVRGRGTLAIGQSDPNKPPLISGTLHNEGLVAPGSDFGPFGTFTVIGSYVQHPSGTLDIHVNPINGQASALNVEQGTIELGGQLRVIGKTPNRPDTKTIVANRNGRGIKGRFASIDLNNLMEGRTFAFIDYEYNFLADQPQPGRVTIHYSPSASTEMADGLELQTSQSLSMTETSLLTVHGTNPSVRHRDRQQLTVKADHPLASGQGDSLGAKENRQIDVGRFWAKPDNKPATVYIMPLGNWGKIRPSPNQEGTSFHSFGGALGGDYAFNRVGVGAFVGYEWTKGTEDHNFGNFKVNSLLGRGYASFLPLANRNFFLDLLAGGMRNWYTFNRQDGCFTATGTPKGWEYDAYAGLGYNFNFKQEWRFTPLAGAQYIHAKIDSFKETGDCIDTLCVGELKQHNWLSWVGCLLGGRLERGKYIWLPEIRGFWQHQFSSLHQCLQFSDLCAGLCHSVQVQTGDRNYGIVGAELQVLFGPEFRWLVGAAYDYLWSNHLRDNNMYGRLGINF